MNSFLREVKKTRFQEAVHQHKKLEVAADQCELVLISLSLVYLLVGLIAVTQLIKWPPQECKKRERRKGKLKEELLVLLNSLSSSTINLKMCLRDSLFSLTKLNLICELSERLVLEVYAKWIWAQMVLTLSIRSKKTSKDKGSTRPWLKLPMPTLENTELLVQDSRVNSATFRLLLEQTWSVMGLNRGCHQLSSLWLLSSTEETLVLYMNMDKREQSIIAVKWSLLVTTPSLSLLEKRMSHPCTITQLALETITSWVLSALAQKVIFQILWERHLASHSNRKPNYPTTRAGKSNTKEMPHLPSLNTLPNTTWPTKNRSWVNWLRAKSQNSSKAHQGNMLASKTVSTMAPSWTNKLLLMCKYLFCLITNLCIDLTNMINFNQLTVSVKVSLSRLAKRGLSILIR